MNENTEQQTLKEQGFYQSIAWRRVRKLALQRDHYICQLRLSKGCTKLATTVHHIKPLEDYPELGLELSNLTSCCYYCHELTKPREFKPMPIGVRIIKMRPVDDFIHSGRQDEDSEPEV